MVDTAPVIIAPPAKLNYVNALRGWAILLVLLVHNGLYGSTDLHYFSPLLQTVVNQGARGVQLFFVMSAFTLFLSMSRRKQEKHPTRNFFLRRFFRIAPMFYVGIAFYTYWFSGVMGHPVSLAKIVASLTFLHGVNPYWIDSLVPGSWSLAAEWWFYALAPFLMPRLTTVDKAVRFIAYTMLAACLLSIVLTPLHAIPEQELWYSFLFSFWSNQLPVFGFGILLYLLLTKDGQDKSLQATTLLLAAGAVLFVLFTGFGNNSLQRTGAVSEGQHYWFAGAFMLLALGLSKHAPRLLVNPIINYIGEISFSFYLCHFAILFMLERTGHSDLIHPTRMLTALLDFSLRYVLVAIGSILISTALYRLVEIPAQNLGKRLIVYLEKN